MTSFAATPIYTPPFFSLSFSPLDSYDSSSSEALPSSEYSSCGSTALRLMSHTQRYNTDHMMMMSANSGYGSLRRSRTSSTSSTGSSEDSTAASDDRMSTPRRSKLKSLRRQLSNVRRKLEELELGFEETQGYRPSQTDRQTDKGMRKLLTEQSNIKRQIKSVKDSAAYLGGGHFSADLQEEASSNDSVVSSSSEQDNPEPQWDGFVLSNGRWKEQRGSSSATGGGMEAWRASQDSLLDDSSPEEEEEEARAHSIAITAAATAPKTENLSSIRNSLLDMEQRLKAQRLMKGRPKALDAMTAEQLVSEKADLQSALQDFEHVFGAPESDEAKALMKDFYDRYRTVKRLVRRSSAGRTKEQLQELETIPEDEALPFTLASPQHRIQIEVHSQQQQNNNNGGGHGLTRIGKSVDLTELDKRARKEEEREREGAHRQHQQERHRKKILESSREEDAEVRAEEGA